MSPGRLLSLPRLRRVCSSAARGWLRWFMVPMGIIEFFIIAGLVFVNGFFVAAEFALVKVRTSQIDQLAEKGNWAAKLTSKALDHLDAYLSASQLGITVASLALGYEIEKGIRSGGPAQNA